MWKPTVKLQDAVCHPFPLICRHPCVIARLQVFLLLNQLIYPQRRLRPFQKGLRIRCGITAPRQRNSLCPVIRMGIVCSGQCVAAPAFPILAAEEVGFFLIRVSTDKVRINRQTSIRIRAAPRQEGVHFIFGDKAVMLLPGKSIPRLIRYGLAGELLKLLQHAIRRIMAEPDQRRILGVGRRQPFQTLVQVSHILGRIQPLSQALRHFGKSALEYGQIVKELLRHAIGQVTFHID